MMDYGYRLIMGMGYIPGCDPGMRVKIRLMPIPQMASKEEMMINHHWLVVLTCFNHLEKYEFVNGKDDIPYIMQNKKCLKPPKRSYFGVALFSDKHDDRGTRQSATDCVHELRGARDPIHTCKNVKKITLQLLLEPLLPRNNLDIRVYVG